MAKSLEEQLAEVEAEIARIEKENEAHLKSAEYRERLSVLKAREKTAEAVQEEAREAAKQIEIEVLRTARILHPMAEERLHPDFIAAIEKFTGMKREQWSRLARTNRRIGFGAAPVEAMIIRLKQDALDESPNYKKAVKELRRVEEDVRVAWQAVREHMGNQPHKDPWRLKEQVRVLKTKIERRNAAKAMPADDKKAKAEAIEIRQKVLAIVRGEEKLTW